MQPSRDIARLIEIMAALRNPVGGCPWDLEQDFSSIRHYTIEEAYEVADAARRGEPRALAAELGDPDLGVLLGVGVDRLALAAVVPLVGLHVAVQAELVDGDAASHRPLVDAAAARLPAGLGQQHGAGHADRVDPTPHFLEAVDSFVESAATNASWGTSTRPTIFIRFLPSFCFSSSLRLREMSPP